MSGVITGMNHMKRQNRKWFAYALCGVLLTAGLLFFRFPSEALKDYLQAKAERSNPPLRLSIGDVSPSLSFGLDFRKTELSRHASPDKILFRADSFSVRPSIWSSLRGKLRLYFDGLAYDGALKGWVQFKKNGLEAPFNTSIALKDIRMGEHDHLPSLIARHVEGSLDGTISYNGKNESLIEGTGEADLRLSVGRVELLQPILSLDSIDFNEVLVKMILKNQKINLTKVELKGPNMHGSLSGTVSLRKELMKSSLDLRGTIDPFADFFESLPGTRDTVKSFKQRLKRGTLSFIVRGTLRRPRIKFV